MTTIETLETRRLLSMSLDHGVLTLTGTAEADDLRVWNGKQKPTQLVVVVNGDQASFPRKSVKLIRINGGRGDDRIEALTISGDVDIRMSVNAGAGKDSVVAGAGDDTIIGETGNDQIFGNGGNDLADYSYVDAPAKLPTSRNLLGVSASLAGNKTFEPGGFSDILFGNMEGIIGTGFNDQITGNDADNTLIGGGGSDTIFGGAGNDLLAGGAGTDKLFGGDDDDALFGQAGNDRLIGEDGNDALSGGSGTDFADYSYRSIITGGVSATLGATASPGTASGDGIGIDTLDADVEGIVGTEHPDLLVGNADNNILLGSGSTDTIHGEAGADTFQTDEKESGEVDDFQDGVDVLI